MAAPAGRCLWRGEGASPSLSPPGKRGRWLPAPPYLQPGALPLVAGQRATLRGGGACPGGGGGGAPGGRPPGRCGRPGRLSEAMFAFPSQYWPRVAGGSSPGSTSASPPPPPWGAERRPPGPTLRQRSECVSFHPKQLSWPSGVLVVVGGECVVLSVSAVLV